jgi:hypothetical protein
MQPAQIITVEPVRIVIPRRSFAVLAWLLTQPSRSQTGKTVHARMDLDLLRRHRESAFTPATTTRLSARMTGLVVWDLRGLTGAAN